MGPVMGVPAPPPPLSFQYAVPAPDQAEGAAAKAAAQAMPINMAPQAQQPPPPQRQQVAQQQQQAPQQQAAPQQAPQEGAQVTLTEEQVIQFLDALAQAVPPNGVVPAAAFARGFIERAGPDATRMLLQNVPPERIFETIEERDHKPWRAIVTRDGQRYVREVWKAAAAEVAG